VSAALTPTREELLELTEALDVIEYSETFERFKNFKPHPKQKAHIDLGRLRRERLLMAGNRNGKTETGAFEAACHMTGEYPDDWGGRRFDQPTLGWICGETSLLVRDVQQKKLCGPPGVTDLFGTGMIPKDAFTDKPSLARGVTDAYDTIQVRHKSGGISIGRFKSYEQGRQKFQGEGLDWIWFDEEPPLNIYAEGIARIGEKDGISWLTFTPLKGRSAVVLRFLDDPSDDRGITTMTLDDALHIPEAARKRMFEGYLPHEREARALGVPILGSGRIFMSPESSIVEAPIEYVPLHWAKIWGLDFGMGHPFAAVLLLWDKDADIIHIHHAFRMPDALIMQHARPMKQTAAAVPVAWPHDGHERDRQSGEPVSKLYKREGLRMLSEHATWPDGGFSTEAGILEWDEREKNGRLKVAAHLSDWLEERRFYHRKDGMIVKLKDDLMSATRIAIMAKRFARAVALGPEAEGGRSSSASLATGVDFDLFTGG